MKAVIFLSFYLLIVIVPFILSPYLSFLVTFFFKDSFNLQIFCISTPFFTILNLNFESVLQNKYDTERTQHNVMTAH